MGPMPEVAGERSTDTEPESAQENGQPLPHGASAPTKPAGSRLLRDVPLTNAADDSFAHGDYAHALADVLRDAPSHATVGLFGAWGIGKSSVLEGLRRELGDEAAYAYYDAWRYQGDALRRQFLRETGERLKDQLDGFDVDGAMRDLRTDTQSTKFKLAWSWTNAARMALAAVVAGIIVWLFLTIADLNELLTSSDAKKASLSAMVTGAVFLVTTIVQVLQPVPVATTVRRTEDPERFAQLFHDLLRAVKAPRLVIAIDNLDRCSPDHAVELLSTIKTYLEPTIDDLAAGDAKRVAFVIAVDDEALRRHLLAKELEHSSDSAADARQASRNVDEYLRKFFTVTMRIHPPLRRDVRDYVERQLDGIVARHKLDEQTGHRLAGLLGGPLRSNPRRVKQFINNLELRLTLIEARERRTNGQPPLIDPPISPETLVIAKLAVIEEEWPAHYRELSDAPQRLAEWESTAREPSSTQVADTVDPALVAEWPELAAFLIESSDIAVANVRPFLRYKRSEEERELPGYWEFRAAATAGDRDEVTRILSTDPDRRGKYAEQLAPIVRDELRSRWFSGARAAADVALVVFDSPEDGPAVRAVVEAAIDNPQFRSNELPLLPVDQLVERAQKVDRGRRSLAAGALVTALADQRAEADLPAVARAVAENYALVSESDRQRLRDTVPAVGQLNLATLAPLAKADPMLLGPAVNDELAGRLEQQSTLLGTPDVADLVDVVELALRRDERVSFHDQVVGALGRTLTGGLPPDQFDAALPDVARLAGAAKSASKDARDSALRNVATSSPAEGLMPRLLDAVLPLMRGVDRVAPRSILESAFRSDSDGTFAWMVRNWPAFDDSLRTAVAEALASAVAAETIVLDDIERPLATLPTAEVAEVFARIADALITTRKLLQARDLIWRRPEATDAHSALIARSLISTIRTRGFDAAATGIATSLRELPAELEAELRETMDEADPASGT